MYVAPTLFNLDTKRGHWSI